ncbi:MAG: flagellar hook-associated protein FlgL [bacterium]
MRIPDRMLQGSFLSNLTSVKESMNKIQEKIVTRSKVNRPSDNPLANSRIMRLNSQIENLQTYNSNIEKGLSKIENTITSMDNIHNEVQNVLTNLTNAMNPSIGGNITTIGKSVELSLKSIVDQANAEFNGEYLFGGTDFSSEPYSYATDGSGIQRNIEDLSGEHKIRLTNNVFQKINMSGRDLFQPVLNLGGNVDSTGGVGSSQSTTEDVWDADGNKYTATVTYTMTAANTYDMEISVTDSTSAEIYNDTKELLFNATSGELESIDGGDPDDIRIQISANKIDFLLNTDSVLENDSTSVLRSDLNQKADIFNTLFSIKEKLLAGELPTADQVEILKNFDSHVLNKMSEMGNIQNRLTDTQDMLTTQDSELQNLLSSEKDVDVAKAVIEMQNYDYSLQMAYKISAMILPKSLLEFL